MHQLIYRMTADPHMPQVSGTLSHLHLDWSQHHTEQLSVSSTAMCMYAGAVQARCVRSVWRG